jgi:hypothetical protein
MRVIDSPVLCLLALWNISPRVPNCLNREIQTGLICAGLSDRYDFPMILSNSSLQPLQFEQVLGAFGPSPRRTAESLGVGPDFLRVGRTRMTLALKMRRLRAVAVRRELSDD